MLVNLKTNTSALTLVLLYKKCKEKKQHPIVPSAHIYTHTKRDFN